MLLFDSIIEIYNFTTHTGIIHVVNHVVIIFFRSPQNLHIYHRKSSSNQMIVIAEYFDHYNQFFDYNDKNESNQNEVLFLYD